MQALNPITNQYFELDQTVQLNEIVTDQNDDNQTMLEVIAINPDRTEATVEVVTVEEDWGE
jgi:lysine biosynthesis protein LysW